MNDLILRFRSLAVRRMYGRRFGTLRASGLCDGINIIYGPNATGKTTLARALQAALWPDEHDRSQLELEVHYDLGEAAWRVDLSSTGTRAQRDGAPSERPHLPEPDTRHRYYLHLHELLEKTTDGAGFAEVVMRDASGGFNVVEAAGERGFSEVRPRTKDATTDVDEAREELLTVKGAQEGLRQRQRSLQQLKARLGEAREAEAKVELFERVLAHDEARKTERQARADLEAFPAILETMTGSEHEDLTQLEEALEKERTAHAKAVQEAEEARSALDACPVSEGDLEYGFVKELAGRARRLGELESAARDLRGNLEGAKAARETAARQLGTTDEDAVADISVCEVVDVAALGRRAEGARARAEALRRFKSLLAKGEQAHADSAEAARLLQQWLRAQPPEDTGLDARLRFAIVVAGVLAAAAAIGGAALVHPAALLVLLVTALLAYVLFAARQGGGPDERDVYRKNFERLEVDPPVHWEPDAVADRLDSLFAEQARLKLEEHKAQRRGEVEDEEREAAAALREVDQEREELAEQLGLAADAMEEELLAFVGALERWQQAYSDGRRLVAELEETNGEREKVLQSLREALATFELEAHDAESAHAAVETLREEEQVFVSNKQSLEQAEAAKKRADERRGEVGTKIAVLYERLRVEPGDKAAVAALAQRRADYAKRKATWEGAKAVLSSRRGDLDAHPLYEPRWADEDEGTVQRLQEEAREEAAAAEELRKEVSDIEADVRKAEQRHDLERAQTDYDDKLEILRRARQDDYRSSIGWYLAQHVQAKTADQELPEVFHRARELFSTITAGSYKLLFDKHRQVFSAFDTRREEGFDLDALSSGTRVQLLLAVRIAFVERHEHTCCLPLVLDETLANSDDERARAVIDAVCRLSREGRQVFYFTAQDDEVAKWKHYAERHPDLECRLIALDGATRPDEIDVEALPTAVWAEVPEPGEHTPAEYGRLLEVPRWDGYMPMGGLHLWYLVEDPTVLHRLLSAGIATSGQLEQLAAVGALAACDLDENDYAPIRLHALALRAWQRAWREGRGEKVDSAALKASGAVSGAFMERVVELCEEKSGDGRALVEGLRNSEVRRFHASKADELEAYFVQEGYIETGEPLSEEAIWPRVLSTVHEDLQTSGMDYSDVQSVIERVRQGPHGIEAVTAEYAG